jgi:flagellin
MAIRLNSSVPIFAMTQLNSAQNKASISMQRLSSGLRINSATDDAAGLAITSGITSQIRGYNQSIRNANDGISLLQTAEGTLGETTNVLQRIRELTVQAGNDTNSDSNRRAISNEISMLSSTIKEMMNTTQFNGIPLFSNRPNGFNIGIEGANFNLDIGNFNYSKLSLNPSTTTNQLVSDPLTGESITNADQIMINGYALEIKFPIASATDLATAFNELSDKSGVRASAFTEILLSSPDFSQLPTNANEIQINNQYIDLTGTQNINEVIEQINAQLTNTDIVASVTKQGKLSLTSSTGTDITIEQNTHDFLQTGLGSIPFYGKLNFQSKNNAIAITSGLENQIDQQSALAKMGLNENTGFTSPLKNINVLSTYGISESLKIIDNALLKLSDERATYGAQQNRLEHTINHLSTMSMNSEASRSRILDTDFAAESAELAKNQLLMQTSSAILIRFTKMHGQQILSLLNSLK